MSIYQYLNVDKFYGCRVAVNIDGKRNVRYFSYVHPRRKGQRAGKRMTRAEIKVVLERARELNARWLKLQEKARLQRTRDALPTVRNHSTGVKGITLCIPDYNVDYLKFQVSTMLTHTSFSVQRYGYEGAWEKAVKTLAEEKGIRSWSHLLSRIPERPPSR